MSATTKENFSKMFGSTREMLPRCLEIQRCLEIPRSLAVPICLAVQRKQYQDVQQYKENNTKMSSSNKENRCLVDTRKYQEIWQYQGKHYQDVLQENVTKISGSQHKNVTMLSLSTSISIILIDNMALVYFLTVGILQQKPITWIYQLIKSRRSF